MIDKLLVLLRDSRRVIAELKPLLFEVVLLLLFVISAFKIIGIEILR